MRHGVRTAFSLLMAMALVLGGCAVTAGRSFANDDDGVAASTLGGAAIGAAAGAAGGAVAGKPGKGAAIGAAAGGVAGFLSSILERSPRRHYGTAPCSRWPEGSEQHQACMRGYSDASTIEAERQGRCAGGDQAACNYDGGGYGYGYYHYYRYRAPHCTMYGCW